MQPALFRLGAIVASPDFLAAVPRPALVQAIRSHATDQRVIRDGQPILMPMLMETSASLCSPMRRDSGRRFVSPTNPVEAYISPHGSALPSPFRAPFAPRRVDRFTANSRHQGG